jgi:capping protein beta
VENSLAGLLRLSPDLTEDLLNAVDQPLKVATDSKDGRQFILCDFNRDGDAYRSPWSNEYCYGEGEGELFPRPDLRALEVEANAIFDVYRKMYFNGGHSSVYFFETVEDDADAWGACFLIHKVVPASATLSAGSWDSVHVFDAKKAGEGRWTYQLTSTVMVSMAVVSEAVGRVDLSGNMTKPDSREMDLNEANTHIMNIGRMLEENELQIRNNIEGIYIQKTREIMNGIRNPDQAKNAAWESVQKALAQNLAAKSQ